MDYFGQTVNVAGRVQALAGGWELCEDAFRAPGVARLLEGLAVHREPGVMKGVGEAIPVYRVQIPGA